MAIGSVPIPTTKLDFFPNKRNNCEEKFKICYHSQKCQSEPQILHYAKDYSPFNNDFHGFMFKKVNNG